MENAKDEDGVVRRTFYITERLPAGERDREYAINVLERSGFVETFWDGSRALLLEPDESVADLVSKARSFQGDTFIYSASATMVIDTDDGALGDPACRYSAKPPHLRCAVNPNGPCKGCGI